MSEKSEQANNNDTDADNWSERITGAIKESDAWWSRCEKIKKIYRDKKREDAIGQSSKRMNILWSNIQTIMPVIYSRLPIPVVQVKNPPASPPVPPGMPPPPDPASEVALVLKKALATQIREYDFDAAIKNTTLEYSLTARGTGWIAYEPEFESVDTGQVGTDGQPVTQDIKIGENAFYVFINHKDFITNKARTWDEVTWVGRGLDLSKQECQKYFADLYKQGKIQFGKDKKLRVWEIWDKDSGEQIFVCPDNIEKVLKRGPAPIKFNEFFPCPRPLYSNLDNETIIPVPDYAQYQDQAGDLNKYTDRLSRIGDAMKVRGVYQSVNADLQRLFDDNQDNIMVPTNTPLDNGMQPFQFVPLEIFAQAAAQLVQLKDMVKQDIYEITGLSDVLRGQSDPNETATAQNIKNQWGSLRVKEKQKDVQRFIRDILRLKSEVMAELFSVETLQAMSGIKLSPEAEQFMRNGVSRKLMIDVETDSTIEPDAQQEKQDRTDFLQALSGYMNTAMELGQASPALVPMLTELVMFGVKAFPVGSELEQTIKQSLDAAAQQAMQPKPPSVDEQHVEVDKYNAQTKRMEAVAGAHLQVDKLHSDRLKNIADHHLQAAQQEVAQQPVTEQQ